jgi:hypothetical protein
MAIKQSDTKTPTLVTENRGGAPLRYPFKRIGADDDYMRFDVLKYKAPGIAGITANSPGFDLRSTDDAFKTGTNTLLKTIILPLPKAISDGQGASWGDDSINSMLAAATSAAASVTQPGGKSLQDAVGGFIEGFGNELADQKTRTSMSTAAIALGMNVLTGGTGDINSLVSRATGNIINPNVELLFNGVQLRGGFNFIYDLIPRNQTESESIKNIIRTFKQQMLPNKKSTGFFIEAPNVFQLKYMKGNKVHPFLNLFKICALTNMSVDYSGSGTYASYHDATPVHMVLNLQFQELSPIYAEDYDNIEKELPNYNGVGY